MLCLYYVSGCYACLAFPLPFIPLQPAVTSVEIRCILYLLMKHPCQLNVDVSGDCVRFLSSEGVRFFSENQ